MKREELIAAMQATRAPKPVPVKTPKWGTVYVKPRTVEEVDLDSEIKTEDEAEGKKRNIARGAARIICDEAGNRIFDPTKEEDLALLAEQPWSMLRSLLSAVETNEPDEKKEGAGTS